MRKYTSNKTYFSGAIIYELEKKFGKQNITKNLQELKKCDYEMFYKYFKAQTSELDEKIDILLKDRHFWMRVMKLRMKIVRQECILRENLLPKTPNCTERI